MRAETGHTANRTAGQGMFAGGPQSRSPDDPVLELQNDRICAQPSDTAAKGSPDHIGGYARAG
jgi:hypothetical protein